MPRATLLLLDCRKRELHYDEGMSALRAVDAEALKIGLEVRIGQPEVDTRAGLVGDGRVAQPEVDPRAGLVGVSADRSVPN